MRPFTYERATDADGAMATADHASGLGHAPRFLGGGTNLVDLMKLGVEQPGHLIDVTRLGHDQITPAADGGLHIGAGVRNSDAAADPAVRRDAPLLSEALLAGASGQLRNAATIGGNLLQRTRCGYFQDTAQPCNKRVPGSGCAARQGEHHNHAILGHSAACIATNPSDMAVALAALGATVHVHVRGASGTRQIGLPGLHRLPGDDPQRDTILSPTDLITGVSLPAPVAGARSRYRKVRERSSYAFALVSVAVRIAVEDDRITHAAVAFGGLAHVPWRAERAEAVLEGAAPSRATFHRAAEAELSAAEPLPGNAYKVPLARNILVQTLTELAA